MRITVLGASGQVGQQIVGSARERGLRVRAVWRRPPEPAPEGVEVVVEPDPLDVDSLRRVSRDADAILCAIGQRRARPRNPWSRLRSPPDLCRRLVEQLHAALGDRSPRLVVVSAAGVAESWRDTSPILRLLFRHSTIGIGYRDLCEMESYLERSGRDCLAVRPTTLSNGARTGCRPAARYRLWSRISRRAVAEHLVARAIRADFSGFEAEMITG